MAIEAFPLLTYQEAAEQLRVSERQVRYLIQRGELPVVTVGLRSRRVRRIDLDRYVEGLERPTNIEPFSFPGAGLVRKRKVRNA